MNGVPVLVAVSFKMIDTLRGVLQRKEVDPAAVDAVAQALVSIMRFGPRRLSVRRFRGNSRSPSVNRLGVPTPIGELSY
jgi:hypothetical protein